MFKQIVLALFILLSSNLVANKTVSVTAVIDRADYADKSIENLQLMAMQQAKLEAASKLFGDFIKSETVVKDGSLIKDLILAKQGGIIHIEGDPVYTNGENLGELKVSINAYATAQDIKDMTIQRLEVKDFIYSNPNLNLRELEKAAKDNFLISAIAQKKPSLKIQSNALEQAKKLAVSVHIEEIDFNADWLAYKLSGYVEYIPIFLRSANGDTKRPSFKMIPNSATLNIISPASKKNFITDIEHNSSGFVFTKETLKQLSRNAKTSSNTMTINAKLMIPKEIKKDIVTILIKGAPYSQNTGSNYSIYINNNIMDEEKIEARVIHHNNQRYVNLAINASTSKSYFKAYFLPQVIDNLTNMHFSILSEDKNIPSKVSTIKPTNKKLFKSEVSLLCSNAKYKTYTLNNNGVGFVFTKEIIEQLTRNAKNNSIILTINAKLMIPKSIKEDLVTITLNGAPYKQDTGSSYSIAINNTIMDESEIEAVVIQDGNLRYINLSIYCSTSKSYFKDYFLPHVIGNLTKMNFSIRTEYREVSSYFGKVGHKSDLEIKIDSEKSSKVFKIQHNDSGFLFTKKIMKQLSRNAKNGSNNITINAKLLIPKSIKEDMITIVVNGAPYKQNTGSSYSITLNNKIMDDSETEVLVKQNGNQRYVNLSINGSTSKSYFNDYFLSQVIGNLTRMNFTILNNEKAYALKILKE